MDDNDYKKNPIDEFFEKELTKFKAITDVTTDMRVAFAQNMGVIKSIEDKMNNTHTTVKETKEQLSNIFVQVAVLENKIGNLDTKIVNLDTKFGNTLSEHTKQEEKWQGYILKVVYTIGAIMIGIGVATFKSQIGL